ncbi:MAG: bifunctional demethylmenaquinone methyltransferase/2-methoxy-6-polyprenyl-1,4-benzoquinol methylase UbiE [Myxococcota bacterium]|nr:bifunctional demethylmenaquinone methyltransferase/2-methoxy-6-polyprenyl-1,4-benzoquinol methylase UbiE [Myxococcota bacterium]
MKSESLTPVAKGGIGGSGEMFDAIAHRYDRLNRILSMGLDQGWRKTTLKKIGLRDGHKVLDLATGTGDLAMLQANTTSQIVGLDPSANMLAVAQEKVDSSGISDRVKLVLGDAQDLEFPDNHFDRVTIAFGIRNVPDRMQGLREMVRVLKPGGMVGILELNEPERGVLAAGAKLYIRRIVPWIGAILSGSKEYRYLQESIAAFPNNNDFKEMMRTAGFTKPEAYPLTFGVCTLFVGTKGP